MLNIMIIITAAAAFAGFVWYRDRRPGEQEPWIELLEEPLTDERDDTAESIAANHERLPPAFIDHTSDEPRARGPGGIDQAA
ncbi:MAG: hypothetical protein KGJ57_18790 [Sphingomonadales bacterium]|nr:hypothetical protein [Sphingomonadales bacterium]MDE2171444.1 hypothetical protein [Sphingomonadales bacterium]